MAITTNQLSVGTAATIVDGTYNSNFTLIIHNIDNTDAVYLGGPEVTVANGLVLQKEETIQLQMGPLDSIYAVSAEAGHTISYLKQV